MSEQQLYAQLEQLREELAAADSMDAARRERLLKLIEEMEAGLEEDTGLVERMETAVAEFEVSHPTLAAVMNKVIETLGNIGV
jgi:Domain of unknown function (DUF4404)